MLALAIAVVFGGTAGLGLFMAMFAAIVIGLSLFVLRDASARRHWCITVEPEELVLDLPRQRSIICPLKSVHARLPFDRIEAIEARFEAYRSFGMVNMQRSYALKLRDDDVIVLGEDRARGTGMSTDILADAADLIARRGGLEIRDLGMAKGRGGVLSLLFSAPPRRDAPTLSDVEQSALWRGAQMTGWLSLLAALVVLAAAAPSLLR